MWEIPPISSTRTETLRPTQVITTMAGRCCRWGGHKGYALSLVVDLFAGALTGGGTTSPTETVNRNNMMSLFIDPTAYGFQEETAGIAASYLDWIRACKASDPGAPILIPGEPEQKTREQRLQNGIEVPEGIWQQIVETAEGLGLSEAQLLA